METTLLKNRAVREYLKGFPEDKWNLVVKYTLIYGIQALKEHYPLQTLTLQKLEEILKTANSFQSVEDNIPVIEDRLKAIKQTISEFENIVKSTAHSGIR